MRKIREVLRLKYELGLGHRAIAASCAIARSSVSDYLRRADEAGLTWQQAHSLSDAEVEQRLFRYIGRHEPSSRAPIDFAWVHRELRRAGVTLQLLWLEYQEATAQAGTGARAYPREKWYERKQGEDDRAHREQLIIHASLRSDGHPLVAALRSAPG